MSFTVLPDIEVKCINSKSVNSMDWATYSMNPKYTQIRLFTDTNIPMINMINKPVELIRESH